MKSTSAISIGKIGSRTVLTPKKAITCENREELQATFEE
jgi:hypothetical protein